MSSMFSSLFSRDPSSAFPFTLDGDTICSTQSGISLKSCRRKVEPKEECTLHTAVGGSTAAHVLKTSMGKLRTMRHPNIVTYVDGLETDATTCLVTESCSTVEHYLRVNEMSEEQREQFVAWGVYQILCGLKFLHTDAKLSHNAVRTGVYITRAGDWKMGELNAVDAFRSARGDLMDVYHLMWDVFNDGFDVDIQSARRKKPGNIPKRLHSLCAKIVKEASRTSAEALLDVGRSNGGALCNKLVHMLLFVDEYELKEAREKASFFASLTDNLSVLPANVAMYKVLPKLIQAYEFGDVGVTMVPALLSMSRELPEEEYQRRIVPCICKLFASPDRAIRVKLLHKLPDFVPHLSEIVINEGIFGNICTGFLDTNPAIREATVKAMVVLAPKLSPNNLNVELMRHFARLQGKDDQASIRTNTTICLGKIGQHLAPSSRQKILISAFTRATRDSFPAARMASVLSLTATQQYYQINNIAQQILPAIVPLTVDADKQVRDEAFKSVRGFLTKLEQASDDPTCVAELESQVNSSTAPQSDKVPQWASWAMGALSGKFYKTPAVASTDAAPTSNDGSRANTSSPKPTSRHVTVEEEEEKPSNGWDDEEDNDFMNDIPADVEDDADWSTDFTAQPAQPTVTRSTNNAQSSGMRLGGRKPPPTKKKTEEELFDDMLTDGLSNVTTGWSDTHDGWGDDPTDDMLDIAPSTKPKTAASARSTARKAEMEEKRAARKTGGAMKLGSRKV